MSNRQKEIDAALESPLVSRRLVARRQKVAESPARGRKSPVQGLHRSESKIQRLGGKPLYAVGPKKSPVRRPESSSTLRSYESTLLTERSVFISRTQETSTTDDNPSPLSNSRGHVRRNSSILSLSACGSHDILSDHPVMQELLSPVKQRERAVRPVQLSRPPQEIVCEEESRPSTSPNSSVPSKLPPRPVIHESVQTDRTSNSPSADPVEAWLTAVTSKRPIPSQGTESVFSHDYTADKGVTPASPPGLPLNPSIRTSRLGTPPTARRLFSAEFRLSGSLWDTTPHAAKFPSVPSTRSPSPRESELAVTRRKYEKASPSPRMPERYYEERSTSYPDLVRELSKSSTRSREYSVNEAARISLISSEASTRRTIEWAEGLSRCHIADATELEKQISNAKRSKAVLASQLADEEAVHRLQLLMAGQDMPAERYSAQEVVEVGIGLLADHEVSFRSRMVEEEEMTRGSLKEAMAVSVEQGSRATLWEAEWSSRVLFLPVQAGITKLKTAQEEEQSRLALEEYVARHRLVTNYAMLLTSCNLELEYMIDVTHIQRHEHSRRRRLLAQCVELNESSLRKALEQQQRRSALTFHEGHGRAVLMIEQTNGMCGLRVLQECWRQETRRRCDILRNENHIYESLVIAAEREMKARTVTRSVNLRLQENEVRSRVHDMEIAVRNDIHMLSSLSLSEVMFRTAVRDEEESSRQYVVSINSVMGTTIIVNMEAAARSEVKLSESEEWHGLKVTFKVQNRPSRSPPLPPSESQENADSAFVISPLDLYADAASDDSWHNISDLSRCYPHDTTLPQGTGSGSGSDSDSDSDGDIKLRFAPYKEEAENWDLKDVEVASVTEANRTILQSTPEHLSSNDDQESKQEHGYSYSQLTLSEQERSDSHSADNSENDSRKHELNPDKAYDEETREHSHIDSTAIYNDSYEEIVRSVNLMCDSDVSSHDDENREEHFTREMEQEEVTVFIRKTLKEFDGLEWMKEGVGRESGSSGMTAVSSTVGTMRNTDYEWDKKTQRSSDATTKNVPHREWARKTSYPAFKRVVSYGDEFKKRNESERWSKVVGMNAPTKSNVKYLSAPRQMSALLGWMEEESRKEIGTAEETARKNMTLKFLTSARMINTAIKASSPPKADREKQSAPTIAVKLPQKTARQTAYHSRYEMWKRNRENSREIDPMILSPIKVPERKRTVPSDPSESSAASTVAVRKKKTVLERKEAPVKRTTDTFDSMGMGVYVGVSGAAIDMLRKIEDEENETRRDYIERENAIASQLATTSAALNQKINEMLINKIAAITHPDKKKPVAKKPPAPPPPPTFWGQAASNRKRFLRY
eukprot:TRINITY_DN33656_c0_g1_i1.p1 TRINITY_DN33656_c0_g1~~TRINITY_DN33656_c0_g1_i1.p1  ORF type:complete len:1328 (+),score=285.97 TRINITY_DN33656_c0_g1_i1:69-4052(+)